MISLKVSYLFGQFSCQIARSSFFSNEFLIKISTLIRYAVFQHVNLSFKQMQLLALIHKFFI